MQASSRHFMAGYMLFFFVGFAFCGVLVCLFRRRRKRGGGGHSSSTSEKGRDLLPSSDTPQSPSSASLFSEAVPFAEKRNGTLNGHGGHMPELKCGYIFANSSEHNLQDTSVNLADGFPGKERAGPEGEEGFVDGLSELGDGLGLDEEFAKLHVLRGAPLAQCEESSI